MWALNYIARELEMPFGNDPNDLPLDHFHDHMNSSLLMLIREEADIVPHIDATRCLLDYDSMKDNMSCKRVSHMSQEATAGKSGRKAHMRGTMAGKSIGDELNDLTLGMDDSSLGASKKDSVFSKYVGASMSMGAASMTSSLAPDTIGQSGGATTRMLGSILDEAVAPAAVTEAEVPSEPKIKEPPKGAPPEPQQPPHPPTEVIPDELTSKPEGLQQAVQLLCMQLAHNRQVMEQFTKAARRMLASPPAMTAASSAMAEVQDENRCLISDGCLSCPSARGGSRV
jgi:hypothetical protein